MKFEVIDRVNTRITVDRFRTHWALLTRKGLALLGSENGDATELQFIEGISGLLLLFGGDFWLVKGEEVIESKESVWSTSVMVISSDGSSLISQLVKFP